MKQLLLAILLCYTPHLFADTPGKKEMYDSKISFQNVNNITHITWHWQIENSTESSIFTLDTSFYMSASRGAPVTYKFWGTNGYVNPAISTDTLSFHNYYSPDYVIIINGIHGQKIRYIQKELSNKNKIVAEGNTDDITNKVLIADAKKAKQNHYIKMGSFIALGVAALGGIVWFVRRRKKEK
jgi:LPXTG-motif cell wall-anchored protein